MNLIERKVFGEGTGFMLVDWKSSISFFFFLYSWGVNLARVWFLAYRLCGNAPEEGVNGPVFLGKRKARPITIRSRFNTSPGD